MLLKVLLSALALFVTGVGTLRVSVMLENYILLFGGLLLSAAAILLLGKAPETGSVTRG